MDTLKILFGAAIAVVLGLVITFALRMQQEVNDLPKEEISKMRQQVHEMELELQRLQLERERKTLAEVTSRPAPSDTVTREEAEAERAAMEARLRQLEEEANAARDDAKRAEEEAGLLNQRTAEGRNKSARRSRIINDATLMAQLMEWHEDPETGSFGVIRIQDPDNVQPGTVLAIRRNGGILGKLEVTSIEAGGAIATPISHFTEVKPEAGDELILNEIVELAN